MFVIVQVQALVEGPKQGLRQRYDGIPSTESETLIGGRMSTAWVCGKMLLEVVELWRFRTVKQ